MTIFMLRRRKSINVKTKRLCVRTSTKISFCNLFSDRNQESHFYSAAHRLVILVIIKFRLYNLVNAHSERVYVIISICELKECYHKISFTFYFERSKVLKDLKQKFIISLIGTVFPIIQKPKLTPNFDLNTRIDRRNGCNNTSTLTLNISANIY